MRHGTITLATADDALARRWQDACKGAPILRVRRFADFAEAENVVVLDGALPGLPGFDDACWKRERERLRLVFASNRPHDNEGVAAIDAGFVGYCHAYCAPAQLRQIFDVVESGELWLGRSLVTRLVQAVNLAQPNVARDWTAQLTEREQDVAHRAALAQSNAEIAVALGIGERTVKAHLSGIFEKLGVADRLQLALKVHGIR
jgi:DNA-binding NarL/FixJ family response regulator